MSETATCRDRLAKYCKGDGLDIGAGGDPIVSWAITVDVRPGVEPHICCDAINLPFKDGRMDWVFSSHCLEDFEDTAAALREWLRVIKPGGYLVLFLPDQKAYEARCALDGTVPNGAHKHKEFGLEFVNQALTVACLMGDPMMITTAHALWPVPNNPYSFDLVVQKL
jgi:SAM-dependent methyltransferase